METIEHPTASERGEFSDACFDCGRLCPPTRLVIAEPPWTRSFHSCEADHEERTHADWWTDRKGSEVMERVALFFPEKGDGGTTWSGVPIYSRHSGDVELERRLRKPEQAAPSTTSPRPETQRGERREAKKGLTSRVGGFMIAAVIFVVFGWLAWTLLTAPSCLESEHYTYEECMGTESDDHYGMP
jgi:hypothetical protein